MNVAPSFATPYYVLNVDFWKGLSLERRRDLLDVTARAIARLEIEYVKTQQEALDLAKADGMQVVEPDDTIKGAVKTWIDNGVGDMAQIARDTYGISEPDAFYTKFEGYLDKWRVIVADLEDRMDEDELTVMIQENLFQKIDVESYGMN